MERGRLYLELVEDELYRQLGFSSVRELISETVQVSQRTLQDDARLAQELALCPGLAEAIDDGLDLDRALLVLDICDDDTAEEWIDVARRTGGEGLDVQAQEIANHPPVRIDLLLAHTEPEAPNVDLVLPDLPVAARWFIANVQIPKQHGFQVVRERARFVCANPECRRRTLRCDAHHIVFRSRGGSDDPDENGLCVCRACHLRLIHTGRLQADRLAVPEAHGPDRVGILWTWPDRRVWVV